jgi:hypothetical protein
LRLEAVTEEIVEIAADCSRVREMVTVTVTGREPLFTIATRELSLPAPTGRGPGQRQALGLASCTTGSAGEPTNCSEAAPGAA